MKRRLRARLLLIASAALAATLTHAGARAQTVHEHTLAESSSHASPPEEVPPVALKVDEFGYVTGCDHSARLDNFAIELQNRPGAVGYLVVYGVEGEVSGTSGYRLRLAKDYLVNAHGIDEERLKTIYGGPYRDKSESFSELWVVPLGAEPPKPVRYKNDAATFKGKFAEYQGWDGDVIEYDPGTGPPVGDTTLAGFAAVLRLQPLSVAYVVVYDGKDAAPGAWRRVGERDAEHLHDRYGIDAARVKVLFGGYKKETTVRLWALPSAAPPPVKDDRKERRPEKAARVNSFDQYYLKYEENERRAFRDFAELLKADDMLNICIVVWPDLPSQQGVEPEATRDPNEPPDIDLVRLAEKWKARLSKDYGIGEQRMIVMVLQSTDDGRAGEIETWVVPPGAALPDPSAENGEGTEGEGSEQAEGNPSRSL